MDQAWLDSLSEDWVSQPRSSGSPAPSLPSPSNSTFDSCQPQKQSPPTAQVSSHNPLAERSPSDNNIFFSQRAIRRPSKLCDEISNSTQGSRLSHTTSASTTQPVQSNTAQYNSSVNISPKKGPQETPEWKRRLLRGDVAYGEQRDLFGPGGLESIFQPPLSQTQSPTKISAHDFGEGSITMPSSPPPYNRDHESQDVPDIRGYSGEQFPKESNNRQPPRPTKYKLADAGSSDFSANDLSRSSSFRQFTTTSGKEDSGHRALSNPRSNFDCSVMPQGGITDLQGRIVSAQSDTRNEELSPIYIARHDTSDGKIDYTAFNPAGSELQERLEDPRVDSHLQIDIDSLEDTFQGIPGDMTVEIDDHAQNGHFVNFRRGGYSQDGSFQRRMLSPSSLPAIDESAMLPEESMQASTPKQLPNMKKTRASNEYSNSQGENISPVVPCTPHSSPTKPVEKAQTSSSGSPLKLFGTYDTFTNQKLLRRLSQFEESFDNDCEEETTSVLRHESTRPELNEAFVPASSLEKVSQRSHVHQTTSRKITSFGKGDLDGFQFSEEISCDSNGSNLRDEDNENVSLPVLDPSTQSRFKFQLERSPGLEEGVSAKQRTRYTNTTNTTKQTITVRKTNRPGTSSSDAISMLPSSQRIEDLETPRKRNGDSDGKRLPKSPLKDPTPKRRRTLHETDITYAKTTDEGVELDSLKETHQQMQSVIGRKRKDARQGDEQQAANPKVLAMRQILRPRTPTPSQRSIQHQDRISPHEVDLASAERIRLLQQDKIAKIQAELDSTDPLKASTAFRRSQQMYDDSRKGSVTTQDFLDEAKKIMAGIRGKARPRSGMTSLEESESENDRNKSIRSDTQDDELDESLQESTEEPFSRPPSREGGPVPRLPVKQQDPDLLDHLRKYEEMSDMGGVIASSMKSIAMARDAANSAREIDRIAEETISRASGRLWSQESIFKSEPPNIRIIENPELQRKRKHSSSLGAISGEDQPDAEFPSHGSNASSSQSTSRSIPTGSSRGSDSRRIIAQDAVSHLIPEQLAGMFFDRERNIWVKRKTVNAQNGVQNILPSDETDDDPFGDIPDLSVDETQELQRIRAVAAKRKEHERTAQIHYERKGQESLVDDQRPLHNKSKAPHAGLDLENVPSSEPSKLTRLTSACTLPEYNTRITSWGDDHALISNPSQPPEVTQTVYHNRKSDKTEMREESVDLAESVIPIHHDPVDVANARRRRNVAISFSSPLASVIQPSPYDRENGVECGSSEVSLFDEDANEKFEDDSVIINKRGSKQTTSSMKMCTAFRNTSCRLSLGGHRFSVRPVSRIDEQDEESLTAYGEERSQRSISVVIATPVPPRRLSSVVLATPRPIHEIGTLELTPLSDFTMHQADESFGLEVSYIDRGQRYVPGSDSKRTLSLSIKELVERLTEVEPFEPFWEHIKQMELKSKGLSNLHKLDEFCEQLEELDVSGNQISHLNGAPRSLRHLRIMNNYLSDLTSWGHLSNLQYVDVSNNELESLSAFKYLVHLRGIKADNNKIRSLDGIGNLDGLLDLRLRGNLLKSLDFGGTKLKRLTDLDLKGNQVSNIKNIHELRSLSNLDLENNDLSNFAIENSEPLWALKYLKLSGNNLESIDVGQCPNLRLLYLDQNRLLAVTGLLKTKHLDSLSIREQRDGALIEPAFLSEAFEVRKLFLSGNLLNTFKPRVDFLNLQYLELANCGLESLPIEFGQMLSNTRVLNLNFNALRDIKPLFGIVRLKKLHLAGNRLSRLRKTTNVLAQFPTLTLVDLRSNPLTQGFYSPVIETRLVMRDGVEKDEANVPQPFTLGVADREKDEKYAGCLDMDTRMLRRVYEILMLGGCSRLKMMDGLSVDRSILKVHDRVWDALVSAGVANDNLHQIVVPGEGKEVDTAERRSVQEPAAIEKSDIWQAEDSFA